MKNTTTKTAAILFAALVLSPAVGCESDVEPPKAFHTCAEGKRIIAAGVETTFVECQGSWQHRTQATMCGSVLPRSEVCASPTGNDLCNWDNDCTEGQNGHCDGALEGGCTCRYGCIADADCGPGEICLCGEPVGTCVQATCRTDADCGGGLLCASYVIGCEGFGFACQTTEDECQGDADCGPGKACGLGAAGHRACVGACAALD